MRRTLWPLAAVAAAGAAPGAVPGLNGKIAFVSDRDGNRELYVMGIDGTGQTRLARRAASAEAGPDWQALPVVAERRPTTSG